MIIPKKSLWIRERSDYRERDGIFLNVCIAPLVKGVLIPLSLQKDLQTAQASRA